MWLSLLLCDRGNEGGDFDAEVAKVFAEERKGRLSAPFAEYFASFAFEFDAWSLACAPASATRSLPLPVLTCTTPSVVPGSPTFKPLQGTSGLRRARIVDGTCGGACGG